MAISNIFNERYETAVHLVQIILSILVIGFSSARMNIYSPPPSRINFFPITMGAKSLILIAYQLLSAHVGYFERWASTKANAVINCLEVVFWFTVVVITGMSTSESYGSALTMSVLAMLVAMVLVLFAIWTAVISVKQHRRNKFGEKGYGAAQSRSAV